ncbi:hypothetical protein HGRIS_006810 [Hohenbuehelia grisea]|uniref:Uncharacterized protein n=1 Tax=Hohenbuehelia grisea TaxID=104357 RepID=A0ABR3JA84_9AGAR
MDPLSSLTLLEVAHKIKETIEKVGQNRTKLRQLASDVVCGIADIQEFCDAHREVHDVARARELRDALDSLTREFHSVLRRCERLSSQRGNTRFAKARASVSAWLNRDEIENDIIRLKEHVQACHIRFISFSSARTEQNVLLLLYEHRARTRQIDELIPDLLMDDEVSRPPHVLAIDRAANSDVMNLYLRHQLADLLPMVAQFLGTRTHWHEVPDQQHSILFDSFSDEDLSPSTIFRDTLFQVLHFCHLLRQPTPKTAQDVASALLDTALSLQFLGHTSDALSMATTSADLYGRLVEQNSAIEFSYHLANALNVMSKLASQFGNLDASLKASGEGMAVWTYLFGNSGMHRYAADVGFSILSHCHSLSEAGDHAQALEYCESAVALARQFANPSGERVRWDFSENYPSTFYSGSGGYRSLETAILESFYLGSLAIVHSHSASYEHAWIAGVQAIKCFQSILDSYPQADKHVGCGIFIDLLREDVVAASAPITRSPSRHRIAPRRSPSDQQDKQENRHPHHHPPSMA